MTMKYYLSFYNEVIDANELSANKKKEKKSDKVTIVGFSKNRRKSCQQPFYI